MCIGLLDKGPYRLGKGTQNMSVNGNDPGQNKFQMDGVTSQFC